MGNFSRFFIDRPVFAMVLAIIITLAGTIAAFSLPVAQYPEIAPPTVTISTTYPGASAETIASTVAAPIEEQLSGAEGMIYYNSNSGSDSTLAITATFEVGTDVDKAVFQLNNRVQVALPRLPEEVRRNGVLVQKRSNDILVVIALRSTDDSRSSTYLADYAYVNLVDDLKRIPGVGDVTLFGAISSMRVWLQPDKMARLGVTPSDVLTVIRGQNAQFAAGKVGAEPAPPGQALTFTVNARGRLQRPEEFENLIVRANGPQGVLRLKDVATIELGALNYDTFPAVDGKTSIGMAVFQQTGANALQVTDNVKKRMEEVKTSFPTGVEYLIPFDTTLVVKSSIAEVKLTILEAALLVLAVVFLFLQTWRATIIPMLAVPVSIIGTFAGLYALGFSINTLTLFAMVLAIGIVVDDAIVVLENVERLMREQKMRAREASIAAMHEVSGAVLAIVLVLCAVFIPVAFLGGIAGQLYKQFAVTVAVAVVISGFTALTLTPALCALLLEVHDEEPRLFKPFNRAFAALTRRFLGGVNLALARRLGAGLAFLGLLLVAALLFWRVPTSFLPSEDQGYLLGTLQLPDGASIQRTKVTAEKMQKIISEEKIVDHAFMVPGRDLIGGSNKTNAGTMFILLKDWDTRKKTASELATELTTKGSQFTDGRAIAFNPPSIRGLGTAGGFEFYVQSRTSADPQRLGQVTNEVVDAMAADARLQGMNTFFRPTAPQLFAQVDREKAISLGVPPEDVFNALQSTFGTFYVNDFNLGGRTFRVQVQAEPGQRSKPEQLGQVYVRSNTTGEMVPLRALLTVRETAGPEQVERFNGFLAAKVLGSGKPGISSGQAIEAVEEVAAKVLPAGYSLSWSGQAFQEKRTGSQSLFAFGLAIVMVFLILAALYERWRLPTAVVLAVPFAIVGALGLVALRGMENDIYFQIGLVVLIGLAAKNAILIVEFAQQGLLRGMSAKDAAIDAARLRFRPIVMTSLAFVFGVLPLAISSGAGSAARRSMGTGVVGGMLIATFVATMFIPLFVWFSSRRSMSEALHHENAPGALPPAEPTPDAAE